MNGPRAFVSGIWNEDDELEGLLQTRVGAVSQLERPSAASTRPNYSYTQGVIS
jgi:hypothetical protein